MSIYFPFLLQVHAVGEEVGMVEVGAAPEVVMVAAVVVAALNKPLEVYY